MFEHRAETMRIGQPAAAIIDVRHKGGDKGTIGRNTIGKSCPVRMPEENIE
jgi:hypothetical protein